MMNKKGFIATYIVDFYAYLVFVAIVIVFFLVLTFMPPPAEGEKVTNTKINNDATLMLIQLLQQPVTIDDKQTTVLELIQNTNINDIRKTEKTIKKIIDKHYLDKNKKEPWLVIYLSNQQPTEQVCKIHNAASGQAFVPLKTKADYFTIVFCIPMGHFK